MNILNFVYLTKNKFFLKNEKKNEEKNYFYVKNESAKQTLRFGKTKYDFESKEIKLFFVSYLWNVEVFKRNETTTFQMRFSNFFFLSIE